MPLDHRISLQNKGTKQGQKLYFPACLGDFNTIFLAMQDMLKKQKKGRMLYNAVDVYGYKIEPVKLLGASDVNPFKDWKQPE